MKFPVLFLLCNKCPRAEGLFLSVGQGSGRVWEGSVGVAYLSCMWAARVPGAVASGGRPGWKSRWLSLQRPHLYSAAKLGQALCYLPLTPQVNKQTKMQRMSPWEGPWGWLVTPTHRVLGASWAAGPQLHTGATDGSEVVPACKVLGLVARQHSVSKGTGELQRYRFAPEEASLKASPSEGSGVGVWKGYVT